MQFQHNARTFHPVLLNIAMLLLITILTLPIFIWTIQYDHEYEIIIINMSIQAYTTRIQILNLHQNSGSGRLKFSDFKDLMCSLKYWQTSFKNHTREKTGILKAERLKDALLEVGMSCTVITNIIRHDDGNRDAKCAVDSVRCGYITHWSQ